MISGMSILGKSLFLVLLLTFITSCSQDETSYHVNLCVVKEHGDESLYFLSDEGLELNPVSSLPAETYREGQRFRVTYVILGGSLSAKNKVDVKSMFPVLIKDAVWRGDVSESYSDPVWLVGGPWCGGGYLNVEFGYDFSGTSGIKHKVQLIVDSVSKKAVFTTFGHSAEGDEGNEYVTALISFPLNTLLGGQEADSMFVNVREGDINCVYRLPIPDVL